jgi:hypothetical protein
MDVLNNNILTSMYENLGIKTSLLKKKSKKKIKELKIKK